MMFWHICCNKIATPPAKHSMPKVLTWFKRSRLRSEQNCTNRRHPQFKWKLSFNFFNDWQNGSYLQSNLNQMLFAEVFSPLTNTLLNELCMNWLLRTPTHGKHHQHCQPSGFRISWHDNWRGPSKMGGIAVHGFLPKRKSMKYAMLVEFVVYTLSFHWRKAAGPKQCKEHKQVTTLSTEFRTMTKTHHYLPRTSNVIGFTNEITFQHQRFG